MKDGAPGGGIFVKKGERGTSGSFAPAPSGNESPHKVRFAGPEIASEGDDRSGGEASAEVTTGRGRFVGVG